MTRPVEIQFDASLYAESCDWIERECINADAIHTLVGISPHELAKLTVAGILPRPTYQIYNNGIISPVASFGSRGRLLGTYFGPAIIGWLRRGVMFRRKCPIERVSSALRAWLDRDFHEALIAQSEVASRFGWSHLFQGSAILPAQFASAATRLWEEWLGGGWAVCLKRFSGYDVVAKDIELERIAFLAEQNSDGRCGPELIDAMLRFDAIVRPFAPFERTMSSRQRVIDLIVLDQKLPWPLPRASHRSAAFPCLTEDRQRQSGSAEKHEDVRYGGSRKKS